MSRKWFLVRAVAALIVIGLLTGLLVAGGVMIYRTGWSQGYMVAGGEDGATVPYAPFGFGHPAPFPTFFMVGLFLLLLVVIGRFFRFLAWRAVGGPWMMAGGPWGGRRARHWRRFCGPAPHGPMPPWCWGWEKPSEEKSDKAGPDGGTGAAEVGS